MKPSTFCLEFLPGQSFDGATMGEEWNGWAVPYFSFEQAGAILKAWKEQGWQAEYDGEQDLFKFGTNPDWETGEPETIEEYGQENGHPGLYPIGSRSWIWEEVI